MKVVSKQWSIVRENMMLYPLLILRLTEKQMTESDIFWHKQTNVKMYHSKKQPTLSIIIKTFTELVSLSSKYQIICDQTKRKYK
jgi:hypothetical protein